jgi:hypothetical protein
MAHIAGESKFLLDPPFKGKRLRTIAKATVSV